MQKPGNHTKGSDQHANTHCNDYIYHLFFPPRTPLRTCLNCYLCRIPLCFANQCISWTTDKRPYFWVFTIPAIRSSIHILKLSIFTFPTFWYHFLASQLLHSMQRILLLHKVPFIIDSLGQVGRTYTINSPTLPVLCLQVLYFSSIASAPYRFIQFLLGVVFQCNRHTAVYTVQLDQLSSLIRKISCRTAAFTVDKCPFQILQVRLLAAFFTAVITKLMFGTEGL